jgi:outer membrane protein W
MKKLLLCASIASALMAGSSQAATVNSDFTVQVALAARCTANNSGAVTLDFGTYTAFVGASTAAPTGNLTFNCTRNLAAPTVTFDVVNGAANGYGVLAGLNYQVTATSITQTGAGTAASAVLGGVGTAATWTVALTGAMAAGQAGDCGGGTATACTPATASHTRTVILTY